MRISVRHETRYQYEKGALGAIMRLRLWPLSAANQTVEQWALSVNGEPVGGFLANAYGVPEAIWRSGQRVEEAVILAEGTIAVVDTAGVVGFTDEAVNPVVFVRPSDLTEPSEALAALAAEARSEEGALASLHNLCRLVNERIAYLPDATDSSTTAAQALDLKRGVCQDFAHVFIAAARALDIPARYVAGYVLDPEAPVELHETHGWAEAFTPGLGWVGFDPARRICVTDQYVRLSWGFDAFDAAPIRGLAQMAGTIDMNVDVAVSVAPGQSQSQQQ